MSDLNQNQDFLDYDDFEDEAPIDWAKYIGNFVHNWKRIFVISFIFGVIGVGVALMQKRAYSVSVVLAPEVQSSSRASGSLGSLASMFGMNMSSLTGSSADALNITIFPEILSSTPFLTQLFEVELSPMPKLPKDKIEARKIMESELPKVRLYDHLTKRDQEKSWFAEMLESIFGPVEEDPDYLKVNVSVLTREQGRVLKKMRSMIGADVDKKTAMTTIAVRMDDPLMCAQLADTVCRRLREYVFTYRTEKEQQNYDYYEALCDSAYQKMSEAQAAYAVSMDNNQSLIRQTMVVKRERLQQESLLASQVYQQMVQQRELSRARLQEMKPVFAVVEPATMPLKPVNSRKTTVLMFGFLGFFFASAWYVLLKGFYEQYMPKLREMMK